MGSKKKIQLHHNHFIGVKANTKNYSQVKLDRIYQNAEDLSLYWLILKSAKADPFGYQAACFDICPECGGAINWIALNDRCVAFIEKKIKKPQDLSPVSPTDPVLKEQFETAVSNAFA